MARDPAQGVIRWFAWLMVAVFCASAAVVCWMLWRLWLLVHAIVGG